MAFDPTRPNLVVQSGPGALAVIDWSGIRPVVSTTSDERVPATVVVDSPTGAAVDLTPALQALDLPTDCFAPFVMSCADQPPPGAPVLGPGSPDEVYLDWYFHGRYNFVADDPHRPWSATASPEGPVAIMARGEIVIWNPADQRIERRLTGVPSTCPSFVPNNLEFRGTAGAGRVVLVCPPNLISWDLASSTPTPAWTVDWLPPPRFGYSTLGVALSEDGTTGMTPDFQVFDVRTGEPGPKAPVETDYPSTVGFMPDGRFGRVRYSGAVDLIDATDASVLRTMTSATGQVNDAGGSLWFLGGGAPPALAFSPDSTTAAVWHDNLGLEIWDTRTGESIAVLGGILPIPEETLTGLSGTGEIDRPGLRRLSLSFDDDGNTLRVSDLRELRSVVDGEPATEHSGLLRTTTWSLRTSDWLLAACTVAGRDLTREEWSELVGSTTAYHQTCTPILDAAEPG